MKRIYIASPYSQGDQADNVKRQIDCANELMDLKFAPYVPLLSHFQHLVHPRTKAEWMHHDLQWLGVCDGLIRLHGESAGADIEVFHARKLSIPTFSSVDELYCTWGRI